MRFQEEQVRAVQDYENLILVVSQALGGKPKNNSPDPSTVLQPKNAKEAKSMLQSVMFPAQTKIING